MSSHVRKTTPLIYLIAFQLRRQRFVSKVDFQALAGTGSDAESTDVVTTSDAARDEPAEPASAEPQSEESDKPCSKPRFHVTDNSYVSVTIASDEFQTSMATNDFSSHSTEASVGGGFGGFAASVSGGHAASKSNSNVNTASTFQKTMVAKYMVCFLLRLSLFAAHRPHSSQEQQSIWILRSLNPLQSSWPRFGRSIRQKAYLICAKCTKTSDSCFASKSQLVGAC